MKTNEINVGIVGTQFMGRAHSNAYLDVSHFFDLPAEPVLRAACDNDPVSLDAFARRFGWQDKEADWARMVSRDDVDLVDICTPNSLHLPVAVAAARAGKHVICEKPLAMDADEARRMLDAAREADVRHMVAFNYRRVPALALARQLVEQGKIGRIFHFNAVYYQDWLVDPAFPMVWRHDKKIGGSGAHGDMNAHIVDLARFLVGEVEAVCGAQEVFIRERKTRDGKGVGTVTADDATQFLARFRDGAMGVFCATRFATGRKNFLRLELFGSEGSLVFNLERLNELEYYSRGDEETEQGFRSILVTESVHPYLKAWWPPGHIIGWEHTFIHEIGDLLLAIANHEDVKPDFYDGLRCQQVMDAVGQSAEQGRWVAVPGE
ncbi:MAG: Gfo/Idh/MocA family oxidoreductase [Candidatus Glassbacteria bacterium]|nr:Gfo/Idh/MocA family oxidoreductase [Candidatus Glassbacteria bacterium]